MPLLITELMLGELNTISIPTDVIFIFSLLIFFALLGYFFNNIIGNDTNRFAQKKDADSNLELVKEKLEDQFTLESTTDDKKSVKKPIIKNLNFIEPTRLLRVGSLAFVVMGGASLLGLQNMQKHYEGVNTSQVNIKLDNQSTKSHLPSIDVKTLDKTQTNITKISYMNPFFSNIKSSKYNQNYQIKEKQIKNSFSF